jgi:hypothetical protein
LRPTEWDLGSLSWIVQLKAFINETYEDQAEFWRRSLLNSRYFTLEIDEKTEKSHTPGKSG